MLTAAQKLQRPTITKHYEKEIKVGPDGRLS